MTDILLAKVSIYSFFSIRQKIENMDFLNTGINNINIKNLIPFMPYDAVKNTQPSHVCSSVNEGTTSAVREFFLSAE